MTTNFCIHYSGNENEVQLLVHSTNINAVDGKGNSALILAAQKGDLGIDQLLISIIIFYQIH